jgi:hypothetical protein
VSTKPVMGTTATGRRHKRWPETLKREIVAASLAPGGVGLNRSPAIRREREPGLQLAKALSRRRLCAIELDSPSTGSGGDYSGAECGRRLAAGRHGEDRDRCQRQIPDPRRLRL